MIDVVLFMLLLLLMLLFFNLLCVCIGEVIGGQSPLCTRNWLHNVTCAFISKCLDGGVVAIGLSDVPQ